MRSRAHQLFAEGYDHGMIYSHGLNKAASFYVIWAAYEWVMRYILVYKGFMPLLDGIFLYPYSVIQSFSQVSEESVA